MSRTVLNVDRVGKCYVDYGSNLKRFASWFGIDVPRKSEYWAVRDVSFNLDAGDTLGVIGQNGAGKSTLLKLITGTVRPTAGKIAVAGRVSAILELGLGFNPEFSGRQNVYQAGGLMGLSERELTDRMPEIEGFAELGEFFDHPLRTYSSGMQARLAFSLATAVRPDLLIVDEVLSVGDSYFQHKSFDRIRQFKEQGTSIVLVTHALGDVRVLCNRVLLLDKGETIREGLPDEVIDFYNSIISQKEAKSTQIRQVRTADGWGVTLSGDKRVTLKRLQICDAATGEELRTVRVSQLIDINSNLLVNSPVKRLVVGCLLRDRTGHAVWGTNTWHTKQILEDLEPGSIVNVCFRMPCNLGPGSYGITYNLVSTDTRHDDNYESGDNFLVFDVINADYPWFAGTTWLDVKTSVWVCRE